MQTNKQPALLPGHPEEVTTEQAASHPYWLPPPLHPSPVLKSRLERAARKLASPEKNLESETSGFQTGLHYLVIAGVWMSYLNSLNLHLHICKTGLNTPPAQKALEAECAHPLTHQGHS